MDEEAKPVIRFKEFSEPWEEYKFENIYEINNEKNNGQFPVEKTISISSMTYKESGNGADINSLSNYKVLRVGDIAYEGHTNKDFRYGRFVLNDLGNGIMSPRFKTLRPITKQDFSFWKYYVHSEKIMRPRLVKATKAGTMMNELVFDDLKKQSILVPTISEQSKIGTFFSNLDRLITLYQDKYEKLVNIKKSMLWKMFPQRDNNVPEIRFKGFTEAWEPHEFGDIVEKYEDPVPTPHNGYTRLGIRSHAKGTFYNYVEKGKELETAQMHRVAAGNFIVNITFAWEHAVAITTEEDAGKLVSHRFPQFKFHEGFIPEFFKYVILDENFRHHLWLASPGGAGRNRVLNIPEMLTYQMRVPSVEEQKQIASFFNGLDHLIALQQSKYEKLNNIKAACLDGMLV